jgi:hypothetical protein
MSKQFFKACQIQPGKYIKIMYNNFRNRTLNTTYIYLNLKIVSSNFLSKFFSSEENFDQFRVMVEFFKMIRSIHFTDFF